MCLILEDDGLAREHSISLGDLCKECIERSRPKRRVSPQPTQSLLLYNKQVNSQQLFIREVFLLEACDLTDLLPDAASFNEGLLVYLVDFDEDF